MNQKHQLLCAWAGVVYLVMLGLGFFVIAGFIPPLSPTASAEEVAALYQQNTTAIRLGILLFMVSSGFIIPFGAAIYMQMKRFEVGTPIFAVTQFGCAAAGSILNIIPAMYWLVAAFRPDRNPEILLMLSDSGWLWAVAVFPVFCIQNASIGLAIFMAKSGTSLFPRWYAYFNFWMIAVSIPASLAYFLKTGPFAWNGLISFWIPAVVLGLWFVVSIVVVRKAIKTT